MAYYQSTANITRQIEHPHYEAIEVLNYNQDFSNGTTGVSASGDCSISVVDALYKGFEGNYWSANQIANFNNFANSRANATNSSPFNYGTYNKGPISGRGGLSGGWGTMSGKILKIEKTGTTNNYTSRIGFDVRPNLRVHKSAYTGFRGYVWISSGYGSDGRTITFGYLDSLPGFTVPTLDEWYYIDYVGQHSDINTGNTHMSFAAPGTRQIFLAYPTIYAIRATSVSDHNQSPFTGNAGSSNSTAQAAAFVSYNT